MARTPKIWFRKERKAWFVTINGKRHNLGADKKTAERYFHELMTVDVPQESVTVAEVLDRFLVWTKQNRAVRTFDWYSMHLQSFLDSLQKQNLDAKEIRPYHVEDWISPQTWSRSSKRGAMGAVQRAFKWAHRQGLVREMPLSSLEKPSAERRDNCPSQTDFDAMIANTRDENFQDVLNFLWETGCRINELRRIEGRHCKLNWIELPPREAKGKKRTRIIHLNELAREIVHKRMNDGLIFANRNGVQWTRDAINCRMRRIAKKTGKLFAAYDLRHGFCDKLIMAGVDHTIVAALMGHTSAQMVHSQYSHIGARTEFLVEKLNEVSDSQRKIKKVS